MVAIGWMYVVLMAALAEALSPHGTVLGALLTFVFYGLLPLGIVLYLMGTPARKRALRRQAVDAGAQAGAEPSAEPAAAGLDPDGRRHAAGAAAAPVRKEP